MHGFLTHLLTTLRLNHRNKQALVFGYGVPIISLFAFGSIFGKTVDALELAQVLTITALGGACFGMPVSIVSDRERGVWRRYRLAPVSTVTLIASVMITRFLIMLSSALLQIALARLIFKTEWPASPLQLLAAFTLVSFAFLGMGLVIAMVARTASAVQAIGQMIFLPMIIVGGVGIDWRMLPLWAKHVSVFLPGRYAVEIMRLCILDPSKLTRPVPIGLSAASFEIFALGLIGASACLAGAKLFRWDSEQKTRGWALLWGFIALLGWLAVGIIAEYRKMV